MKKKIKAFFPADSNDWHGMDGEWMWLEQIQNNQYLLLNIPLYSYGISLSDTVSVKKTDGKFVFDKIIIRGGNHTYRILLKSGFGRHDFEKKWASFDEFGCSYESSKSPDNVFGINVPKGANIAAVYQLLETGENEGIWHFDEGNYVCEREVND